MKLRTAPASAPGRCLYSSLSLSSSGIWYSMSSALASGTSVPSDFLPVIVTVT